MSIIESSNILYETSDIEMYHMIEIKNSNVETIRVISLDIEYMVHE